MSNFVFQNRTCVYFGRERMRDLPYILRHYGNKILILTGKRSAEMNGASDQVIRLLEGFPYSLSFCRGIEPGPTDTGLSRIVGQCREFRPDVILAVGGGSVIDSAKAVSAVALSGYESVWEFFTKERDHENVIPVVAVPTTIGTGSEMNGGTVITNEALRCKRGFGGSELQPVAAFYNPDFTRSLSERQIAAGASDIIAHIFDSGYFSQLPRMELLGSVQKEVIRTVIKHVRELIRDPENEGAREGLMWASAWGLNGFLSENLKQDASIHMIEHQLSADYPIPHGEGIAMVMPRWLRYCIAEDTAEQIASFGSDCLGVERKDDLLRTAEDTVSRFEEFLYGELSLEKSLYKAGISDSELRETAKRITMHGDISGLKKIDEDGVYEILSNCR